MVVLHGPGCPHKGKPNHPVSLIVIEAKPHKSKGKPGTGSTGQNCDGILRIATNLLVLLRHGRPGRTAGSSGETPQAVRASKTYHLIRGGIPVASPAPLLAQRITIRSAAMKSLTHRLHRAQSPDGRNQRNRFLLMRRAAPHRAGLTAGETSQRLAGGFCRWSRKRSSVISRH